MGFDRGRGTLNGNRFDYVGIKGSLYEETNLAVSFTLLEIASSLIEDSNEFPADNFALLFGVCDAFEFRQESLGRIHANDVQTEPVAVHSQSVFEFVFAE